MTNEKGGRPTTYTWQAGTLLARELAAGRSIRATLDSLPNDQSQVTRWKKHRVEFRVLLLAAQLIAPLRGSQAAERTALRERLERLIEARDLFDFEAAKNSLLALYEDDLDAPLPRFDALDDDGRPIPIADDIHAVDTDGDLVPVEWCLQRELDALKAE